MFIIKAKDLLKTIDKDSFINYYLWHTITDTCKKFNLTKKDASALVRALDLKKTKEQRSQSLKNIEGGVEEFYKKRKEKTDKKILEKYGSLENYRKIVNENLKKTAVERYGSVENYYKYLNNKVSDSLMSKYGVSNPSQLQFVKDKKKQTLIKHYGSLEEAYKIMYLHGSETYLNRTGYTHNLYNPDIRKKINDTFLSKYGGNPFQSEDVKEKIKNTNLERYGVNWFCMLQKSSGAIHSTPNDNFEKILILNGFEFEREFCLNNFCYDFKINNFLIEIDPYATHNSDWSPFGDHTGVSFDYHFKKSKNAYDNNYICFHVFDWCDIDSLLNILKYKIDDIKVTFSNPRLFYYNYKTKLIMDDYGDDCVRIYDDGSSIYINEILYSF